eukprot:TRINITY_DN637_c0_g1_i5.p1 TRINITY_DN637_c0_g1~~TRINITY_DN637_c0_g1_i5.p1  ORF type:complete len:435 (+),score=113.76 TRINITY_DN637_c0_g1_i5:70-1374(+)
MAPTQSRPAGGRKAMAMGLLTAGGLSGTAFVASQRSSQPQVNFEGGLARGAPSQSSAPRGSQASTNVSTIAGLAVASAAILSVKAAGRSSLTTSKAGGNAAETFVPSQQLGAMAPLGYFDPLGFAKEGDEAGFKSLRAAEIKHGRVAMMAAVGAVAQSTFRFPGFEDVKGTFTALGAGDSVLYGTAAIFVVSGVLEQVWKEQPGKEAGNFGDPVGLGQYTEDMRLKELSNGRMAMLSVLGIFAAELATGKDALLQFSALPRRSEAASPVAMSAGGAEATFQPAQQLGAMAPLGYFDPLNFAKAGDEAGFKNLRAAEIKHGRVAMMAAVGAVAQSVFRIPGFENVKGTFTAVGAGDSVLYGTLAIVIVSGVLEQLWKEQPGKEAGNFGDPVGLNQYTEDMRVKEINNGRMAMLSVFGILGAELATGRDAVEQLSL